MTNEEKLILLKDLCARLPYGVNVRGVFFVYNEKLDKCRYEMCDRKLDFKNLSRFQTLKPYLRPMASMTEEEYSEFLKTQTMECGDGNCPKYEYTYKTFDWLNKKMFDYRGFIELGLALEAPEGMYD